MPTAHLTWRIATSREFRVTGSEQEDLAFHAERAYMLAYSPEQKTKAQSSTLSCEHFSETIGETNN